MPSRSLSPSPVGARAAEMRRAVQHLRRRDPVMRCLIGHLGPLAPARSATGFEGVARAIVYQQISGAAGDAIVRRLRERSGAASFPGAPFFLETPVEGLRACGLSPQKQRYLRDLATHLEDGRLDFRQLAREDDERVIELLTDVTGVGRWTAEMYLLFALQRPDVLPVDDLGVRKGMMRAYGFRSLPAASTMRRLGEAWRPFRSYGTYYLWRSLERPAWEGLDVAATRVRGAAAPAPNARLK